MDEDTVQSEETSNEESTSNEQLFSEEQEVRIQQMLSEATSKAANEAKENGRRELQGEQDRNRNVEKRARLAETRVKSYESSLSSLDEETQKDIELARYREQEKFSQSSAQEESQRQQDTDFWGRVNNQVLTNLDNLGIERNDKRLDWGDGAKDLPEARARMDDSVVKILKEKDVEKDKMFDEKHKQWEADFRKEYKLDSVDSSEGSSGGGDDEFVEKMVSGELDLTKANQERFNKIQNI